MNGINEKKLNKAADVGLDRLVEILQAPEPTKEQFNQARIASSVISTAVRYQATRNARLGMIIRVATSVLQDKEERLQYLSATQPDLKLLR